MIGILDIGIGNTISLYSVVKRINTQVIICKNCKELNSVDKIIFPGQGAFGGAINKLRENDLDKCLIENIKDKQKPFLGICIGMQLLFKTGYEFGIHKGLGIFEGEVKKIEKSNENISLPHIGWNSVKKCKIKDKFLNIDNESDFYFAHSNYVSTDDIDIIIGKTFYGIEFPSIIKKDNIIGTQFHIEKSQLNGFKLLNEFIETFNA